MNSEIRFSKLTFGEDGWSEYCSGEELGIGYTSGINGGLLLTYDGQKYRRYSQNKGVRTFACINHGGYDRICFARVRRRKRGEDHEYAILSSSHSDSCCEQEIRSNTPSPQSPLAVNSPNLLVAEPPKYDEEEELFDVEKVLFESNGKFLTKWKGYAITEATWEPISSFSLWGRSKVDDFRRVKRDIKVRSSSLGNSMPNFTPEEIIEEIEEERKKFLRVKWKKFPLSLSTDEPVDYIKRNYRMMYNEFRRSKKGKKKKKKEKTSEEEKDKGKKSGLKRGRSVSFFLNDSVDSPQISKVGRPKKKRKLDARFLFEHFGFGKGEGGSFKVPEEYKRDPKLFVMGISNLYLNSGNKKSKK